MVAYDCLPFSFPSGLGFVTYIQRCYNPLFEGIPRSTCRADVIDLYKKYRFYLRHVFNSLNCNVSLTADLGLSLNKLDFFAITCHWVDDNWVMQKRIIAFLYDEGKGRHDGKYLADSMSTIMRFFNIYRKTLCIALDNASNNTKAIGLLKKELNPPLRNIFHVRCSCHILNLIVKDGLMRFDDSIQKVRDAVAFLFCNANRGRIRDFKNACVENAFKNFRPGPGRITSYFPAGGPFTRMDSHVYPDYVVPSSYDSLLGKANMGAKNYAVVMPDANVEATLNALVAAGFGAAGQRCTTINTVVFVGGSNSWEDKLAERAKVLKVNAGTEPGADLGPVISKQARERISKLSHAIVDSGAILVLDGRQIAVPKYELGNFIGPRYYLISRKTLNFPRRKY
ncbi:uncharacterized protein LOC132598859 isoform X2 [Lycium barbarum]|uniref:uncharacterized protein LOC132598859 isoform X2 n=1 Tax=Lycium barbarum TaxID=112863 RepID=UPI00293EACC8|nr:uncharacterized protein LOC132598859 isoform X2 [Lycium barbarum]